MFDHLFQCQLSYASIQIDLNRSSDAYELLARACSKYLYHNLDHWIEEKPSTTSYRLASLFPESFGVRPSIFRIKRIVSQKLERSRGIRDNCDLYIAIVHEIAALGSILSVEANESGFVFYLECLDPLWSELFGKLLPLDDTTFALLKGFAYIQRSNHLFNSFGSFQHPNYLDDIATAYRYLSEGGYPRGDLEDQLVTHVEDLRLCAVNNPHLECLGWEKFSSLMARDFSDMSCRSLLETQ
jgi:hypothetical protein